MIKSNPDNGKIHHNLSLIYFLNKNYQNAWEHLKISENLGFKVNRELKKELAKKLAKKISLRSFPCKISKQDKNGIMTTKLS